MSCALKHPADELLHDKNLKIVNSLDALKKVLKKIRGLLRKEILRCLVYNRILSQCAKRLGRFCIIIRADALEFGQIYHRSKI